MVRHPHATEIAMLFLVAAVAVVVGRCLDDAKMDELARKPPTADASPSIGTTIWFSGGYAQTDQPGCFVVQSTGSSGSTATVQRAGDTVCTTGTSP